MAFDLAEMDTLTLAEQGMPMPVLDFRTRAPKTDDDGTPITITLLGRQSEAFRDRIKLIQTKRVETGRNDADAREQEDVELLIVCTRDWSFKSLDGKPFPCTGANIRALWQDARFRTLREAALQFLMADGNFLAPSLKGSGDLPDTHSSSRSHSRTAAGRLQPVSEATG